MHIERFVKMGLVSSGRQMRKDIGVKNKAINNVEQGEQMLFYMSFSR